MSQKSEVLQALKNGDHITPLQALNRFGSLRLADIIYRLRGEGWQIETTMIAVGENKHVAEYWLKSQRRKKPKIDIYFGDAMAQLEKL